MTQLEHVNLAVPDIDEALVFLRIVAPDFVLRKEGQAEAGYRWAHFGNDTSYIALQEPHTHLGDGVAKSPRRAYKNHGLNHLALVVDDLQLVCDALDAAGYRRSIETPDEQYRARAYFYDATGLEWELIEYFSEDLTEKFQYE